MDGHWLEGWRAAGICNGAEAQSVASASRLLVGKQLAKDGVLQAGGRQGAGGVECMTRCKVSQLTNSQRILCKTEVSGELRVFRTRYADGAITEDLDTLTLGTCYVTSRRLWVSRELGIDNYHPKT